jgi:anti-sigma-K factor RskA
MSDRLERLLADTLADPSVWVEPRGDLEDLVVRAVLEAEPRAVTPGASITPLVTPPRHRTTSRRRRQRRRRASFAIAAAIAAIAITGGVLVERRDEHPDFDVSLTATALAPNARASADMYRSNAGFRIELDARGLPKLPTGRYYQAWLTNPAGTEVSIGTFSASAGHVTLWSGVSPQQFPMFSVTIEATDNNQASSGRRVLEGETS